MQIKSICINAQHYSDSKSLAFINLRSRPTGSVHFHKKNLFVLWAYGSPIKIIYRHILADFERLIVRTSLCPSYVIYAAMFTE